VSNIYYVAHLLAPAAVHCPAQESKIAAGFLHEHLDSQFRIVRRCNDAEPNWQVIALMQKWLSCAQT
jgi:hypothetical protein